MDYGRKDFFVDPGLGFRDSVSPSWFDGWKANFAYNHMPLTRAVHYDELARAKDNDHFDFIRDAIAEELTYKDRAANAPISAQFAAGITDLVNLGFLIPGVGQVRAAKTGIDAVKTAGKFGLGAGLVSEARRAPFAYADSDYEAAANVAMTTMFSGIFGGTFHYGKPFVQSTARKVVDFANGRSHKHIFKEDGSVNLQQERIDVSDTKALNESDIYDGNVNNPLGSPTQKILNNPKIPQTVKRLFYLMNNNSSVGVKGNVTGAVAEQSVHQRIAPSLGTSYKLFGRLTCRSCKWFC